MRKNHGLLSVILLTTLFIMACSCGLTGLGKGTPASPADGTQSPGAETQPTDEPLQVEGNPAGIVDLWTAPDGKLWMATADGIYIQSEGGVEYTLADIPIEKILGAGEDGVVWVLPAGASSIYAYGTWKEYGAEQGWEPLPPGQYLSPAILDGVAVSADGQAWLASGLDDLRRYDPSSERWEKYTAAQIGFPAYDNPDYQGYFLTDAVLLDSGEVWVGACVGEGEVLTGRGVVRFSDGRWSSIEGAGTACVMDMEVTPNEDVFVGDQDGVFQYRRANDSWTRHTLPAYERSQLVERLDLDANGRLWVEVRRMGGASSFGGTAVYFLQEPDDWVLAYESGEWTGYDFAAAPDGDVYFSSNAAVMRWRNGQLQTLVTLDGTAALLAVDGDGTAWAAVPDGPDSGLWKVVP